MSRLLRCNAILFPVDNDAFTALSFYTSSLEIYTITQCPYAGDPDMHLYARDQILWWIQSSPHTCESTSATFVSTTGRCSPPGVPVMMTLPFLSVVPCDK